ncbi:hypothetical protein EYF80_014882 [Liparis tanakae]|uniref:Uncharacterized protein n=1 Tax=Liparis tanakae TaxID=230148 RepID=A0A4Z2IBJ6_9TELE|nr:hypothetical protein EYF80_014882 [Liparis tanakae]
MPTEVNVTCDAFNAVVGVCVRVDGEKRKLAWTRGANIFHTGPDRARRPCCCVSYELLSLRRLSAGCGANIGAASPAGRPNQALEAGLIGLTYSIKPSIKPAPLTTHWGLTASDTAE